MDKKIIIMGIILIILGTSCNKNNTVDLPLEDIVALIDIENSQVNKSLPEDKPKIDLGEIGGIDDIYIKETLNIEDDQEDHINTELSWEEPPVITVYNPEADLDSSGYVDKAEWEAWVSKHPEDLNQDLQITQTERDEYNKSLTAVNPTDANTTSIINTAESDQQDKDKDKVEQDKKVDETTVKKDEPKKENQTNNNSNISLKSYEEEKAEALQKSIERLTKEANEREGNLPPGSIGNNWKSVGGGN